MVTILLPRDFKEFLQLLNEHQVNKSASGRTKDLNDLKHLP